MASTRTAYTTLTGLAGIEPARGFRVVRVLREDEQGESLMPLGAAGRHQEAHVEPGHLSNLILGLLADPVTDAPDMVRTYRGLVAERGARRLISATDGSVVLTTRHSLAESELGELFDTNDRSLGGALDRLVIRMQQHPGLGAAFQQFGMTLRLRLGLYPQARITVLLPAEGDLPERTVVIRFTPPQGTLRIPEAEAPITTEATIPIRLFAAAGELWGDTLATRERERQRKASKIKQNEFPAETLESATKKAATSSPKDAAASTQSALTDVRDLSMQGHDRGELPLSQARKRRRLVNQTE